MYYSRLPVVLWPVVENAPKVKKAWGFEWWIVNTENYCFKVLEILPGFQCSMHRHSVKDETFIVQNGEVILEQRDIRGFPLSEVLHPGDQRHIATGTLHRFGSIDGAVIFEISTHHDDSDSYRITESGPICQSEKS